MFGLWYVICYFTLGNLLSACFWFVVIYGSLWVVLGLVVGLWFG